MSDISSIAPSASLAASAAGTALSSTAGATGAASSGTTIDPKLKKAAQQFEAIFVRQMLAEARKANFGDTLFSDQGGDTFREMQDARFADIASSKDSFGLAGMIEKQLAQRAGTSTAVGTSGTSTGSSSTGG